MEEKLELVIADGRHWRDKGCNSKSRIDGTIGACLNRANSICLNLRSQNVTSNKVEL